MSDKVEAWMPFYVGDYLGDTQRLTTEQHGAYLLLILDYWRNGPAPDDDAVLQQITRLDARAWKKHRPALAKMFAVDDGEWRHKRIDKEIDAAKANQDRRSSKAKAAADARWGNAEKTGKECPKDAPGNAPGMPQAMLGGCPPPSPSPSPNGDMNDDRAGESAKVGEWPGDLIELTDRLARLAGVPNTSPGSIMRNMDVVKGWMGDGLDPETEIAPVLRQGVADATSRISSMGYFDASVRQERARKDAAQHGHKPKKPVAVPIAREDKISILRTQIENCERDGRIDEAKVARSMLEKLELAAA